MKSISDYNFDNVVMPDGYTKDELLSLDFIKMTQDFIFFGQTGRGKTHLAIALGIEAINKGMSVGFLLQ